MRWASVLFSETARNAFLPEDAVGAWQQLLFPTVGALGALLHAALPARLHATSALPGQRSPFPSDPPRSGAPAGGLASARRAGRGDGEGAPDAGVNIHSKPATPSLHAHAPPHTRALSVSIQVTPPDALLPDAVRKAVGAYEAAGGTRLVVTAADGWNASRARPAAEAALVSSLRAAASAPPKVALAPLAAVDAAGVTLHAYEAPGQLLAFVLNNATGCFGKSTGPLPPTVAGLSLELASLGAAPASATEVVSGRALPVQSVGAGRWSVALPDVAVVAAVAVKLQAKASLRK